MNPSNQSRSGVAFGQLIEKQAGPKALADWLNSSGIAGVTPSTCHSSWNLAQKQATALSRMEATAAALHLEALIPWIGPNPGLIDDMGRCSTQQSRVRKLTRCAPLTN